MKKVLLLVFLMFILITPPAYALDILVNDLRVDFDVAPLVENGRTLVPIRSLAEKLGARVAWSPSAQTVTIFNGKRNIVLAIGGKKVYINDKPAELETPPVILKGRTLVPLRFIVEQMGESVMWDAEEERVYIGSRRLTFDILDEISWVAPKPIQGEWHRSTPLSYQDFAVIQSKTEYLSKPPLQTLAPIEPPKIDYSKYIALWAYLGEAPTGGYSLHFEKISREGNTIKITVRRASPQPGQMVTQAINYPEAIARVERKYLPDQAIFRFVDQDGVLLKEIAVTTNQIRLGSSYFLYLGPEPQISSLPQNMVDGGSLVEILATKGEWVHVRQDIKEGWLPKWYLSSDISIPVNELSSGYMALNKDTDGLLYPGGPKIIRLAKGKLLKPLMQWSGWYYVGIMAYDIPAVQTAWVPAGFLSKTTEVEPREGFLKKGSQVYLVEEFNQISRVKPEAIAHSMAVCVSAQRDGYILVNSNGGWSAWTKQENLVYSFD